MTGEAPPLGRQRAVPPDRAGETALFAAGMG